jgi:hypothetical protein
VYIPEGVSSESLSSCGATNVTVNIKRKIATSVKIDNFIFEKKRGEKPIVPQNHFFLYSNLLLFFSAYGIFLIRICVTDLRISNKKKKYKENSSILY